MAYEFRTNVEADEIKNELGGNCSVTKHSTEEIILDKSGYRIVIKFEGGNAVIRGFDQTSSTTDPEVTLGPVRTQKELPGAVREVFETLSE